MTIQQEPTGTRQPAFGEGPYPEHRTRLLLLSLLAGFLLTVVWSAAFVDRVIGDNVANTLLGYDVKETPVPGMLTGTLFAFVSGLAGTFTACNIAAFGAVAPLVGREATGIRRLGHTLRPLGWIAVGMLSVSAVYGVIVALVGTGMPQFSTAPHGGGLSPRIIQAMVVFGVIGLSMLLLGLVALGVVRNPLAKVTARHPQTPLVVIGALIGGFLIGRPFPLFRIMFRDAAESGNVLYGAGAFMLQSVGNIVVMSLLFLLLVHGTRGRLQRWMTAKPGRLAAITAAGFLVAGAFTLLYWDLRLLGRLDLFWYPTIDW
ncbi:hypothetical protein [Amycolatopsis cihanbeyliensis]|uniref:Cytochrome C biogenesis DsbD-like protein n=1 Tax=Amycolatopsis cihanbeyliensis TaxID=1128664 RepID=A0A542DNQ3_AMYCI|nr:hypothetical protein [Amycolatopsis cihanbeyliensis]TQJ04604.1 hypothetical protein FB471_4406 [Amycolatopsis cihanbeyliensis]